LWVAAILLQKVANAQELSLSLSLVFVAVVGCGLLSLRRRGRRRSDDDGDGSCEGNQYRSCATMATETCFCHGPSSSHGIHEVAAGFDIFGYIQTPSLQRPGVHEMGRRRRRSTTLAAKELQHQ
jgi:hypothetical protein